MGASPLYHAALRDRLDIFKLLVAEKADPSFTGKLREGFNAFHGAVSGGGCEVAKMLIQNKASVNDHMGGPGCSPLCLAALNNKPDMVNFAQTLFN